MQAYDLLMLIVLAGATAFGAWKGFAWQVASFSSMVLSYVVALRLREPVSRLIDAPPPWNKFAAMLGLYIGASLVVWVGFRFVSHSIERLKLKSFDRQIGALVGLAKGILLCTLVTLFAVTVTSEPQRAAIIQSSSGFYIARLLDEAHGVMPAEYHEVVHPYLHSLDPEMHAHRHDWETENAATAVPGQGSAGNGTAGRWPNGSAPYANGPSPYANDQPVDARSANGPYAASPYGTNPYATNPYSAPPYSPGPSTQPYAPYENPRYAPPVEPNYAPSYGGAYQPPYAGPNVPSYGGYNQPTHGNNSGFGVPPYNPNFGQNGTGGYAPTPARIGGGEEAVSGRAPAPSRRLLDLPAILRDALK